MRQNMILSALLLIAIVAVNESVAQTRMLVQSTIYLESTNCSTVGTPLFTFVETAKCLQHTNRLLSQSSSVKYTCEEKIIYTNSNKCEGAHVIEKFDCNIRSDLASVQSQCKQENDQRVFVIDYFTEDTCSGLPVNYLPEGGFLASGVLDTCIESKVGTQSMITTYNADGYLTTLVYNQQSCQGQPTSTFNSQLSGTCNPATIPAANSTTPFYLARMLETPAVQYIGQVNLNQEASDMNAQIAGASIGVLCGFTALLILVSMTGILG